MAFGGNARTFVESAVAFMLVLLASGSIYLLGKWKALKVAPTAEGRLSYACGEQPLRQRMKIQVSTHKYLICFMVFDSTVVLVAFAALTISVVNLLLLTLYMALLFFSGLLLAGGE